MFIMDVMLNIEELIIHLEKKITQYRFHQKRAQKARIDLCAAKGFLNCLKNDLQAQMASAFKVYRTQVGQDVKNLVNFCEGRMATREQQHIAEVYELRGEIQRQHKVISAMRKEVEDLQELMIMQAAVAEPPQSPSIDPEPTRQRENEEGVASPPRRFGGLEVIEQQTERTVMSSARSMQEQKFFTDAFIRIQEQEQQHPEHYPYQNCSKFSKNSEIKLSSCDRPSLRSHSESSSSASEWASHQNSAFSKQQQMMELSNFSQRVHSLTEEAFPCYESLPISMQEYSRPEECRTWEGRPMLIDITESRNVGGNGEESEMERQSRSKMFLEEFRKTFDRCLSSSGTSRKNSTKNDSNVTKNSKIMRQEREGQRDSQRLISQMLKDIDNNNKFCVGNRKAQLRYDGARKGGTRQGQGTLYYSNGFCYEGEFKSNLRHGYGVLKYNQTEIYRGEWQADELCGQGKIRNATAVNKKKGQNSYPSASAWPLLRWVSYCGYFRNNRFEGEGTLYLQGGQKFLGRFICGAACGQGTLYRRSGQVQTGIWRNNQLVQTF